MKKPTTKFVYAGYLASIIFEGVNLVHNYFQYPDVDKFIAYSLLACVAFAVTWLYDKYKSIDYQVDYVETKGQDMWKVLFPEGEEK